MKQKIVLKVEMRCEKCRSKAMRIAAKANGGVVSKVEIQGEEKDELVVIGEDMDPVKLTQSLRKGLGYASLLSIQEEKEKEEEKKEKEATPNPIDYNYWSRFSTMPNCHHQMVVCDTVNPSACSIM